MELTGSRLRPKTLQAVDVPIIDNRQCERWHKSNGINVVIYEEMMCAGYRGGLKDSCQVGELSSNYFIIFLVDFTYLLFLFYIGKNVFLLSLLLVKMCLFEVPIIKNKVFAIRGKSIPIVKPQLFV